MNRFDFFDYSIIFVVRKDNKNCVNMTETNRIEYKIVSSLQKYQLTIKGIELTNTLKNNGLDIANKLQKIT